MRKNTIKYPVNYADLKRAIRKSAVATEGIGFIIDFEKLNELVESLSVVAVPNMIKSKRITPEDVAFLGEFFVGKNLEWINQYKAISNVIFIRADYIDDKALALMEDLRKRQIDFPDIDKVNTVATLLAEYPCYSAAIVSYRSNDPKRYADLCLEIICKANKVTIDVDNKAYHKPTNEEPVVEEPEEGEPEILDDDDDEIIDETGNDPLD